jgi:23S rRNA U2552 (ribose-2'-O)-methylase RlmE/FtsJ
MSNTTEDSAATTTATETITTVQDETFTFWLQNYQKSKNNNNNNQNSFLLSEKELPLPTIDQVLNTVAPFETLAQRDTEYLAQHSPQLILARDGVKKCKHDIHPVAKFDYQRIRDRLFPLAKSGPMSRNVQNRAPYKLLESMDELGITRQLFGNVAEIRQKVQDVKAQQREKRTKTERGSGVFLSTKERKKAARKLIKMKPRDVVFVDVCGGPGGFSQALLDEVPKLPNTKVRGYGMTLDFKTADGCDLRWYPTLIKKRNFTATYGIDGTGSVYNPANVESLVSVCSFEHKIHFVMGDGGFEVDDDKLTMQESITSRIVFSQWYIALRLLSEGGSLVLKLFETSSVFLRSMLTLSCLFFEKVAIVKPAHSRVVNSERYLSCTGFRKNNNNNNKTHDFGAWINFLQQVHCQSFEREGQAPFTLLPNISLVIGQQGEKLLDQVLTNLENSIVTTATRQAVGLNMIISENNNKKTIGTEQQEDAADVAAKNDVAENENQQQDVEDDDDDANNKNEE